MICANGFQLNFGKRLQAGDGLIYGGMVAAEAGTEPVPNLFETCQRPAGLATTKETAFASLRFPSWAYNSKQSNCGQRER
jgi:hypothetical protein